MRVEAVGVQSGTDRLLDVLVRKPVLPREHLDGVPNQKVEQDHERIELHAGSLPELAPHSACV